MFQQFLENNHFLNTQDSQPIIEKPPPPKKYFQAQSDEESSDEEGFFDQYFEERPSQQDLYEEIYTKMIEDEGLATSDLEAQQQIWLADLQSKVLILDFELSALRRMNHDLKSKLHKNKQILDDQRRDRDVMDKIKSNLEAKLKKIDEKGKHLTQNLSQLQRQMNITLDDLQESTMKRVNNLVKISDKVEILDQRSQNKSQSTIDQKQHKSIIQKLKTKDIKDSKKMVKTQDSAKSLKKTPK